MTKRNERTDSPGEFPAGEGWMPLLEHIGELRRRVIYVLIVFVLGLVGGLFCAKPLFDYLVAAAPTERIDLHTFSPWDAIGLYMKFAFVVSFVVVIPFAMVQMWLFVRPALHPQEQKAALRYVPGALVMLVAGILFGYYVVFPMAYSFTEKMTETLGLEQTYGAAQYFSFLFNIVLPLAVLFELPLLILFLTRLGILNPQFLKKFRRLAWFVMVFVGTVITPPDVISDLLVAVPLIVLYELSILLSSAAYRKKLARQQEWEEQWEREAASGAGTAGSKT
ncbi:MULTISPECIES: twin-arginine translocase subunit TatC [Cohnella]|uniref:twin-arginine translocase subunit TatC n=2 Tax=Paenibacillaceae TaxID=186822 RepID=UPI000376F9F8|nr:twin-arginine translocase subunit TatC [Cohnella sp.]